LDNLQYSYFSICQQLYYFFYGEFTSLVDLNWKVSDWITPHPWQPFGNR